MEEVFKNWISILGIGIEASAAIIIGFAAIEATISSFKLFFINRGLPDSEKNIIRIRLGSWLVLALELELAADILGTAVAPTWDEIGKLAAIIVLRTLLNYFLQKEVDQFGKTESSE